MTDARFSTAVRPVGDSVVIDIAGDVNAFASEELEGVTDAASRRGTPTAGPQLH